MKKTIKIFLLLIIILGILSAYVLDDSIIYFNNLFSNYNNDGFLSVEDYLGIDYNSLTETQIKDFTLIYDAIKDFQFNEDENNSDKYDALWFKLDDLLISYGLDIPFQSRTQFINSIKNEISIEDYNKLIEIDKEIISLNNDIESMNIAIEDYYSEMNEVFENNNMNANEIWTQIDDHSIHLIIFDIINNKLVLSSDNLKQIDEYDQEDLEMYNAIWNQIVKIIPEDYFDIIVKLEINTDGVNEILAHVIPENDELTKWRLAIDINDSIDINGNFKADFTDTIIHEFGHILTLNNTQVLPIDSEITNTYVIDEGILKPDSYLNMFYQEFWLDIITEYITITTLYNEDALYEFYEKYENSFVSDYAATHPAEDIAESFRVFVTDDKPNNNNSIRNAKINFFYQFDEFVELREKIRTNLE